ncbi:MAG: serine/threonine-protein kinase [Acidobacteriota bacterium]
MIYCPKCQQNYDEGTQRFCSNDGARLLPAPSSGKYVNQSNGVFTNLLGRIAPTNEIDEKLSPTPKFVKAETFNFTRPDFPPTTADKVLKNEPGVEFETEFNSPTQKPLARIIKPDEIPSSQAKLGDRKINLTLETADVLVGQTVKSRYRILKKLDADDASVIYLAVDKIVPDKKVIVQILMKEEDAGNFADKIFAEERVSLSLINHPNIARILDSGELFEGKPFIISEFAEGESVKELMQKTGEINALRTARIISQTADALSEAHRNGVLHRNLKPENIVLTVSESGNEQVKLINFGVFNDDLNKENLTYKSPEQIEGKFANFASDIYSLAVIAYQMLTNRLPFSDASVKDFLDSQRDGLNLHPTNLRLDLPASVEKIFERALNLIPSERYPKAHDFGESLSNSLSTNELFKNNEKKSEINSITDEDVETVLLNSTLSRVALESVPVVDKVSEPLIITIDPGKKIAADNKEIVVRNDEESAWEKRSVEPSKISGWNFALVTILGGLIFLAGIWVLWTYFLNRPPESQMIEVPTESVFPTPEENINASAPMPQDIEVPPLPRKISQPPNTIYFQNSKEDLKGDLAKNFLGFSLYYPKEWKQNDAKGKFLDISKDALNGTMIEQMLVSYYDSKGTFETDTESFPALVKETNTTLKEIVPNYEVVSEGEKTVNSGWRAYEIKFKGSGTRDGKDITLWGKRLFIPTARPGMKNGYVITMLATSLSPDAKNVDDVGVKGELSTILESFEPNQSF